MSVLIAALVVIPVAMLAASILTPRSDVWSQQWATRLPGEIVDTALLLAGVGVCSTLLGTGLAWLVSAYRFPGVRVFGWMLILPLAMPSYILGFLTLATLGPTGPVQDQWRSWFGTDAWFPDIESIWGATIAFTLVLYPYTYLLARAALRDQAGGAYFAARILGAGPTEAARRVVLPLVRPAIAAGAAVVMMETLTDFATVQYFGVDTVSVGVFRIWRGTYDRDAAAEIATVVLAFALVAIAIERIARGRARFGQSGGEGAGLERRVLTGWRAVAASVACGAVVVAAFAGPVLQLVVWAVREQTSDRGTPLVDSFPEYLSNSVQLMVITVVVCLVAAVVVANAQRFGSRRLTGVAARAAAIGYAVPGPVVGMGVILAVVGADELLEAIGLDLPGAVATGSLVVLVYAYVVRFLAPGLGAVESGLGQVSEEMTASARSLGASSIGTIRRVHLPLSKASLLSAAILVGVDALKELPIVLLLRPFGFETLPVWVYNLASESRYEQAALPALSIILVALIPVALLSRRLERPG
ncbi:iron(III) transport system permease protein [Ilumatobacter fluminis]|uniref:Iron(III) transport system permease protein n=1 Tax=Ilumatobacter fluminis TaxID=467091 RepID=A0A4R7I0K1_9ACTN|nr:iron ABC transporter permease [Ilumatobacter fluminis]TDT16690.1 iron(III) transport system permease protein [Ilumatobacter fluminis]